MATDELWRHFHRLRELEISNLWNRSKLLGIFIGVLFGGYGVVALRIIDDDGSHLLTYHLLAFVISSICLLFALIWVMMSKGSKAWCEIYEKRIRLIENELKMDNEKRYNYRGRNVMPNINNCILSTKAGAFSPSRINIFIGIAMFWIWLIPIVVHATLIFMGMINSPYCYCLKTIGCCMVILITLGLPIFLFFNLRKTVKSRFIINIHKP